MYAELVLNVNVFAPEIAEEQSKLRNLDLEIPPCSFSSDLLRMSDFLTIHCS